MSHQNEIELAIMLEASLQKMNAIQAKIQQSEYDQRLRDAAPELLVACLGLLDMATDNRTHGLEIDAACAVIAKAEGRSS